MEIKTCKKCGNEFIGGLIEQEICSLCKWKEEESK